MSKIGELGSWLIVIRVPSRWATILNLSWERKIEGVVLITAGIVIKLVPHFSMEGNCSKWWLEPRASESTVALSAPAKTAIGVW